MSNSLLQNVASCTEFCPEKEAKMRVRERLLHFYELRNGSKNVPGILVKEFARSAAGVKTALPQDLRTKRCLQQTLEYLLKDIILDQRKPYNVAYDFIFDRLRAIRQEVIVQNLEAPEIIKLLEPIIMFLAYSRYRLCEEPIDVFDTKICEQHLQECLKRVLCCYDEMDASQLNLSQLRRRSFIEALYQIFNLGSTEALSRCLTLPADIKADANFQQAFRIGLHRHQGNLYRVLQRIQNLPHLLCAVASIKVQCIRRNLLEAFAHAYSSKQLSVPTEFVRRLLCYTHSKALIADCVHYNLKISRDDQCIIFNKADFDKNAAAPGPKNEEFVREKLKSVYLPGLLLLKKF